MSRIQRHSKKIKRASVLTRISSYLSERVTRHVCVHILPRELISTHTYP